MLAGAFVAVLVGLGLVIYTTRDWFKW